MRLLHRRQGKIAAGQKTPCDKNVWGYLHMAHPDNNEFENPDFRKEFLENPAESARFGWARDLPGDVLRNWPRKDNGEPVPPAFLTHRSGVDMDDTVLISMLEAFGIPCLRRYPNDGEFGKLILGLSGTGVDIYVPETLLEDAHELI
jgi:hypothetical protein